MGQPQKFGDWGQVYVLLPSFEESHGVECVVNAL